VLYTLTNCPSIAVAFTVLIVLCHCLHQGCHTFREPTTGALTTVRSSGLGIHAICRDLVVAQVIAVTPDWIAPHITCTALFDALPVLLHPSVDSIATPLPVITIVGDPDSALPCTVQPIVTPYSVMPHYPVCSSGPSIHVICMEPCCGTSHCCDSESNRMHPTVDLCGHASS